MSRYQKTGLALLAYAAVAGASQCCYSSSTDCDSARDWCSATEAHCTACSGNFSANQTLVAVSLVEVNGTCCYSGPKDCDSSRDWCSASASRCTICDGTFHSANASVLMPLLAVEGNETERKYNYSQWVPKYVRKYMHQNANQRQDGEHSWLHYVPKEYRKRVEDRLKNSANASNASFMYVEVTDLAAEKARSKCCYASDHDCDAANDWCSESAAHCTECNGTFKTFQASPTPAPTRTPSRTTTEFPTTQAPTTTAPTVEYTKELRQCIGLEKDNAASSWEQCEAYCTAVPACEVWQFDVHVGGQTFSGCWSGGHDSTCGGPGTASYGGRKVKSNIIFLARRSQSESRATSTFAAAFVGVSAAALAFLVGRVVTARRIAVPTEALG